MKNLLILLLFIYINASVVGQEHVRFSSHNYMGVLSGQNGSALQIQTINGIAYKTWHIGAGVGIDGYYSFSSPVFLSIDKSVLKKGKNNFSIFVNGGVNLPWKQVQYHYGTTWGYKTTKLVGAYWEGGLNYERRIGKRKHVLLAQLGFSYKHMGEILKQTFTDLGGPSSDILFPSYQYDYYLKTFSFKVGWG